MPTEPTTIRTSVGRLGRVEAPTLSVESRHQEEEGSSGESVVAELHH